MELQGQTRIEIAGVLPTEEVAKLEAQFTKYEVFRCTSDLVVVTTGDVASNAIKQALGKLVRKSSKSSLKPG